MTSLYDNDDNFSFASSSFRASRNGSFMNTSGDFDSDENSSLTEIVSTKNDLKVKYSAALQTKETYEKRKRQINEKIQEINRSGKISMRLLDEKKKELTEENDRLQKILDEMPTVEFLQEKARTLNEILEASVISANSSTFLDSLKLQEIGILGRDESLGILQERLKSMVERLNYLMLAKEEKKHSPSQNSAYFESFQLRKKINLMQKSHPESKTLARYQCEQLEESVCKLREEVQKLREKQKIKNTTPLIHLKDLQHEVDSAGGDPKKLICIRGNLYKYNSTLFNVEYRFKRIYAVTKEIELPFVSFIKTLISTPKSYKRIHSLR
ncbi:hypothetical protein TRFO_02221 [Tritrichomonas foetus]|uniref:Uncharacterized protein n=1 Tax=Tritrichomonas foetus TaxID=1144522 RepID=A0A1J4J993_9EUKA|nr:hypothetical protein TRFO_02221 [Tritrichomonas foetus]|eukprot:OHS95241.1 hypothetical protein TRFO_02221 [Tritrichomonas foetus]